MLSIIILLFAVIDSSNGSSDSWKWKQEINPNWDMVDHRVSWNDWKLAFNKTYLDSAGSADSAVENKRYSIWLKNWQYINDFNINSKDGVLLRLNQFGDLTKQEFKYYVNGQSGRCLQQNIVNIKDYNNNDGLKNVNAANASIDWTNHNGNSYVTPVKNQGSCGSCWAFAATGCIESRGAIKNGQTGSKITSLSEQQLVDCSTSYGNNGCGGGLVDYAFKYVRDEGGLCSESEYRYTAKNGACKATTCGTKYDGISTYIDVKADSTSSLEEALMSGPVAVGIEADEAIFQFYSSGVMQPGCDAQIDHGVLVVGYGTDAGGTEYYKDYWKVKNSWGASWGMQGYVLLCRNCNANLGKGECGLLQQPSYVAMK